MIKYVASKIAAVLAYVNLSKGFIVLMSQTIDDLSMEVVHRDCPS